MTGSLLIDRICIGVDFNIVTVVFIVIVIVNFIVAILGVNGPE